MNAKHQSYKICGGVSNFFWFLLQYARAKENRFNRYNLFLQNFMLTFVPQCSYLKKGSHGNALAVSFFQAFCSFEKRRGKLGRYISFNENHVLYIPSCLKICSLPSYFVKSDMDQRSYKNLLPYLLPSKFFFKPLHSGQFS